MSFSFINKLVRIVSQPIHGSKSYTASAKVMIEPQVTVKQGKLRGVELHLLDGTPYYSFKGIPYAHVPARFLAPIPSQPWEGLYDATKHGAKCPQYDLTMRSNVQDGDENCLYLNVYTRTLKPDAKTPVMVFIHGGAYMSGSGNVDSGLGPEFLIQHDVMLVTINYRLEIFGFLCLDTPEVPGNAGMKDQVEALRWVKTNIAQFGGDPDNITLFGESAGSASVTLHMQSHMSKGLFNKAITQSGVGITDWALGKNGKERALRAAKFFGKDTADTPELVEFLRSIPADKLPRITFRSMTQDEKLRGLPIHFGPVVEKRFENVESFLTEEPIDAVTAGQLCKMPLMIGYNSDESLLMLGENLKRLDFINKNPRYLVPREIAARVTEEKEKEFGERIRIFYVGNRDFTEEDSKIICDMLSDIHFVHGIHRFANFYSKDSPTYMYKFSCDTELNFVKNFAGCGHVKGACHADELFYLFYSPMNSYAYNENPKLKDIVYRITKLWTNFAKTGNPTPDNSLGVTWSPFSSSSRSYLNIDEELTPGRSAERARVEFWDKIYEEAGLPVRPSFSSHL